MAPEDDAVICTPIHSTEAPREIRFEPGKCHALVSMSGWASSIHEAIAGKEKRFWRATFGRGFRTRNLVVSYPTGVVDRVLRLLPGGSSERYPGPEAVCVLEMPNHFADAAETARVAGIVREVVKRNATVIIYGDWRDVVEAADVLHALPADNTHHRGTVEEMLRPPLDGNLALDAIINPIYSQDVELGTITHRFGLLPTTLHTTVQLANGERSGYESTKWSGSFHVPARAVVVEPDASTSATWAVMTGEVVDRYRVGARDRVTLQVPGRALRFNADVERDRPLDKSVRFGFDTANIVDFTTDKRIALQRRKSW